MAALAIAVSAACEERDPASETGDLSTTFDTVNGVVHVTTTGTPPAWHLTPVVSIGPKSVREQETPDEFGWVSAVALGPAGTVFVADGSNHEIRVFGLGNCKPWITQCKSFITAQGDERSGPAGMQRRSNAVGGLSTGCYGVPPKGNANFAWVQHMVHHLAPRGVAGFVLANGSMSSQQSGEGEIRKNLVEAELVDCMVALPGQLFYSTQIPACLWFLARGCRRRGEILFIDARKLGRMVDRTHRELTGEEVARIAATYHSWRAGEEGDGYADLPGFCKSAPLDEVRKHGHVLTPGRYVGVEPQEDDGEPFEDKMKRLVSELREQQAEGARLDAAITRNLEVLGFGGGP